ncbi:unnamed protein product [Lampetra planeri]
METGILLPALLLVGALVAVATQEGAEWSCEREEHPITSREALAPWVSAFRPGPVFNFSLLSVDPARGQLLVGARNYLFRLSLRDLSLIEAVEWAGDNDTRRSCHDRGKTAEDCQNHVRVMLVAQETMFVCGTNAFSPLCTWRPLESLSVVLDRVSGVARCPFDPRHGVAALLSAGGEVYAATSMDFPGRDPAVYRSLGSLPPLRTAQYNSRWLHDPTFVSTYEIGRYVYIFLREVATDSPCGHQSSSFEAQEDRGGSYPPEDRGGSPPLEGRGPPRELSRVARVCTNDVGGRFVLEDTWTTFTKALLNCSGLHAALVATVLLAEDEVVYGLFSSPSSSSRE